ncbi:uncharacterized protein EI97DRAFT_416252 [Westerdykella ornata]|uniref:Nucleolar protein 12 n=1 Tax=Westerdykella ornata TaxID=318751 RepID=A0A6A6JME7_WESOR|nr:uncharacterized protein EI97DRAFT_416252 [Westerdykella ornata]KAF2277404.1 hypothetical protein EI97DRAFT_416252 [Westerdykella ornata]
MGKSTSKRGDKAATQKASTNSFIPVDANALDSNLSSLFASSLGPVKPPPKSRYQDLSTKRNVEQATEGQDDEDAAESGEDDEEEEDSESSDVDDNIDGDGADATAESSMASSDVGGDESEPEDIESDNELVLAKVRESLLTGEQNQSNKKRKRSTKEEELEDVYMQKLAREEAKEEEKRKKKRKTEGTQEESDGASEEDSEEEGYTIPKHETQMGSDDMQELEKAARTVFLGNVSSEAITSKSAKKTLMRHLSSFIDDLADNKPPHKVESLRFRSTAFASALPKKAAYAKKEILDATTKSTNAYAVYSTQLAAREAVKRLNGTIVLNRHLRVDSVAHPAKTDHRRCVFVGNLGFVDDESKINPDEGDKKKKNKPPSDVEEGLWVHFSKAGKVESVRVVRDAKTRVGKGFAYVQFEDENSVEAALQFNDQKFPPLLPRKLRVVRAKAIKRKEKKPAQSAKGPKSNGVYNAKVTEEQRTNRGRARAMLGKAGAAKSKDFVFEGHRASSKQGNSGLKLGGKRKGKPTNRSSRRAAAWKKAGGKA